MSNLGILNCLHTAKIATFFEGVQVQNVLVLDYITLEGAQLLSGRVLDSRPRGRMFEPHRRNCLVVLEQDTFILAYYWFNSGRPVPV